MPSVGRGVGHGEPPAWLAGSTGCEAVLEKVLAPLGLIKYVHISLNRAVLLQVIGLKDFSHTSTREYV